MSVTSLRKELSERGLLTKGRKEELIDRLKDAHAKECYDGHFELTSTRSSTQHEIRWAIDWAIIEQIKPPQDGEENGEMLESAPCKIKYHNWGCYVEKYKEDNYLSFYVYGNDSAKASYSLYLKSKKGESFRLDQDAGYYDGGWSRGWGWRCWKKLSQLKSNYVVDGKIHVKVKLKIFNEVEHSSRKMPITPAPELKSRNKRMLDEGIFADVMLRCDGKDIMCHKSILATASEVFRAMFQHEMKESLDGAVEICDIESKTLDALLEYIYTENVTKDRCTVKLLMAADKYQIFRLATICMNELGRTLSSRTVLPVLAASHKLSHVPAARDLKDLCFKYFETHAKEVTSLENFDSFSGNNPHLNRELLCHLASKNQARTTAEGEKTGEEDPAACSGSKKRKFDEFIESV